MLTLVIYAIWLAFAVALYDAVASLVRHRLGRSRRTIARRLGR